MLEIIKENKKIFIIFFVAAFLIIIGIIWLPEKDIKLSHYNQMTEEEIDLKAVKKYGDELQLAIYMQDINFLKEKISLEYLEYNEIDMSQYNAWLLENNILTSNISLGETAKYKYGDINIYSISAMLAGKGQVLNIIEEYPEKWTYTFDTFVKFNSEKISKETNKYGAVINSIYQDINYIKFDIGMYVEDGESNYIDISKSDSIKLIMKDRTSIVMATNNHTSENMIIDGKKFTTTECIYNIPINKQKEITKIVFNVFDVDNKEKSISIDLNL